MIVPVLSHVGSILCLKNNILILKSVVPGHSHVLLKIPDVLPPEERSLKMCCFEKRDRNIERHIACRVSNSCLMLCIIARAEDAPQNLPATETSPVGSFKIFFFPSLFA